MNVRIAPAGDSALRVRFGDTINDTINDVVLSAMARLDVERPPGVTDVVPGHTTLLVTFDPEHAEVAAVQGWVERTLALATEAIRPARRLVEIPVLYDPTVAPDLEPLAAEKGLSVDDLATLHAAPDYRCLLLGFRPGFPFLGGLDPRLWTPRLPTPRLRVAAGSVAIGGQQTGIYPVQSPGGWRIVGRTPVRLFDSERADPFLVRPGDRVRLVRIDAAGYDRLGEPTT